MESIARDVTSLESDERRLYEAVVGHPLQENQRVIIRIVDVEAEPAEASRRAALGRAVEIARQGRAAVESQGISTEEADAAIEGAIREVRRSKR